MLAALKSGTKSHKVIPPFLPALNCSLALVSCDHYPDVCAQNNITTYPSVRVFHGSPLLPPTPLTGALDSAHLLSAFDQHTLPLQSRTVVREGEGRREGKREEEGRGRGRGRRP